MNEIYDNQSTKQTRRGTSGVHDDQITLEAGERVSGDTEDTIGDKRWRGRRQTAGPGQAGVTMIADPGHVGPSERARVQPRM